MPAVQSQQVHHQWYQESLLSSCSSAEHGKVDGLASCMGFRKDQCHTQEAKQHVV